jgi:hypothetical protein
MRQPLPNTTAVQTTGPTHNNFLQKKKISGVDGLHAKVEEDINQN